MILKTATAAILIIAGLLTIPPQKVSALSPSIIISEIQTQSSESKTQEFIEITNAATTAVNIEGWRVAYLSAAGTTPTTLLELEGAIKGSASILLSRADYMAKADGFFTKGLSESGGHIIIFDSAEQEIDRVGWGGALYPKLSAAAPPDATKSLQRKIINGAFSLQNDNSKDFELAAPTPKGGGLTEAEETSNKCHNLVINEILADPEGSDATNEFVELYNPSTETITGDGCVLETSKGASQSLNGKSIKSKSYLVVSYANGLLNNGGTVTLKDNKNETIITYPKTASGQVWALINGTWQFSDKPTPNTANVLVTVTEEASEARQSTECPAGKYRNPETNRCRTIATAATASLVPCSSDQERNPETGRCRKIVQSAQATTCPTGQERNADTNRCRKIAAATGPTPCDAGEERNLETNRCRKISQPKSSSGQTAASANKSFEWMSIGIAALGIICLAGYEYRREISRWFAKLGKRFRR